MKFAGPFSLSPVAAAICAVTLVACEQTQAAQTVNVRPPLLGWYTSVSDRGAASELAGYSRAGVNLVVRIERPSHAFMNSARQSNIGVLLAPQSSWIERGRWASLKRFVLQHRKEAALYGWYLYDEPDFHHLNPRRLIAAYRLIRSLDHHPVALVFALHNCQFGRGLDRRYLRAFDLLMFDRYPFYTFTSTKHGLRDWRQAVHGCVRAARRWRKAGPVMVAQAFGGARDGPVTWRRPSNQEVKTMAAGAIKMGATGILFYEGSHGSSTLRHTALTIITSLRKRPLKRNLGTGR